jgi:hypothetical protein
MTKMLHEKNAVQNHTCIRTFKMRIWREAPPPPPNTHAHTTFNTKGKLSLALSLSLSLARELCLSL